MTPTTLLMMCGLPGSGKTTTARRLAVARPAVRLCPDEWMADLEVDLNDEAFRDRLERAMWAHARALLGDGLSVILESGHWLRSDRDEKHAWARAHGVRAELWFLDVPLEERWRRIEHRNAAGAPGSVVLSRVVLASYQRVFSAPDAAELASYDDPAPRLVTRAATLDDIDFLTEVSVVATQAQGRWPDDVEETEFRAGFSEWSREQVGGRIAHSTTSVVELDGERIGRLRVIRPGGHIELAGLQLLPAYQSRGLGGQVLTGLLTEASAAGLPLELMVEKDNPGAGRFYERHGLRQVGETETEHRMRTPPQPLAAARAVDDRPRSVDEPRLPVGDTPEI